MLASLLGFLIPVLAQAPTVTASQQLVEMRRDLRAARDQKDWTAYRRQAGALSQFLNGSPRSLLEMARADLSLKREAEARAEVESVLAMGLAPEGLLGEPFSTIPDLAARVTANRAPVARGSLAWEVADVGLLPEDIDYDAKTQRFFLSSVLEKKIVVLDSAGKVRDFAAAPDGWPLLGLKVDAKHRRLWTTEVALENFSIVAKTDWGRSALLSYDLDTGKLLARMEGPAHSALGDLVLSAEGSPIVSDGAGGGVYQLREKTLERLDHGEFISPQTPAIDAEGKRLFVPDYLRGIGILDLSTHDVRWLPMANQYALDGIDGLYFHRNQLIATQNGSEPERVVVFALEDAGGKVVRQQVIEASTPALGDPTHGVIVGTDFYYIANSGWDTLEDNGERKAGAKATAARIMRVKLADDAGPAAPKGR